MKISIAFSILILAVAAIMGWNNHRQLQAVTQTYHSLLDEAAEFGLSIDTKNPNRTPFVTKRLREEKDAQVRLVAKELIAFAIESEKYEESGEKPDDSMQEKIVELMEKMLSLDVGQLRILIEELRSNKEMKDETRAGMIGFAIMTLASDHPKAALTLLTESGDLLDNEMLNSQILSSSLEKWAGSDPDGALEWVRKNGEKYPDLITDNTKAGLVRGVASNGIALGFDLLRELKLENPNNAINSMAGSIRTPEERTEFLKHYREYLKTATMVEMDHSAGPMYYLADGISSDGFKEGSRWMTENDLSEDEKSDLARDIGCTAKSTEKGLWIEWMGENLSANNRDEKIESVMRNWTQNDFRAAGEWLANAPDSPAKKASVSAYARTVAPHDPKVAAEWALTLPPGDRRKETLNSVYEIWLENESANQAERDAFMAANPAE